MSMEGISPTSSIKGLENVRSFPINTSTVLKIITIALAALVFITAASLLYHYGHLLSPQVFYSTETQIITSGIIGSLGVAGGVSGVGFFLNTGMPDFAERTMRRHLLEAIEKQEKVEELQAIDLSFSSEPIRCKVWEAHAQGSRSSMQDRTLIVEDDSSLLTAVFDGHGDSKAAKYASSRFAELFAHFRSTHKISKAFEKTMQAIQTELIESRKMFKDAYLVNLKKLENPDQAYRTTLEENPGLRAKLSCGGTTACACFVDKQTGRIYTATLGDTEARVYRKIEGIIYSIPLSLVRDWSDREEALRAKTVHYSVNGFSIPLSSQEVKKYEQHLDAKALADPTGGVNVSRGMGNLDRPALSQVPICTAFQLKPGDRVLLACDGLWDFIPDEKQFIQDVIQPNWDRGRFLPQLIKNKALNQYRSTDNISVVTFAVADQPSTASSA